MIRLLLSFLLLCFTDPSFAANKLDLLFYSAPQPIQWDTPTRLIRSTLRNSLAYVDPDSSLQMKAPLADIDSDDPIALTRLLQNVEEQITNSAQTDSRQSAPYPHSISHVNVRLQCEGSDEILLGMTSDVSGWYYIKKLLFQNAAMETVIDNVRGRFYKKTEVEQWIPYMKAKGMMHQLSHTISKKNCLQIRQYISDYQAYNQNLIYAGLGTEPLLGLGAGCSAFAMSVLKVAGLYDITFEQNFTRTLRIPYSMLNLPNNKASLGFYDLFFKTYFWAKPQESAMQISFWDPQLMYNWVKQVSSGAKSWSKNHQIKLEQNSYTLSVNAEKVSFPKPYQYNANHVEKIKAEITRLWGKTKE